jgi:hypothetical protein
MVGAIVGSIAGFIFFVIIIRLIIWVSAQSRHCQIVLLSNSALQSCARSARRGVVIRQPQVEVITLDTVNPVAVTSVTVPPPGGPVQVSAGTTMPYYTGNAAPVSVCNSPLSGMPPGAYYPQQYPGPMQQQQPGTGMYAVPGMYPYQYRQYGAPPLPTPQQQAYYGKAPIL